MEGEPPRPSPELRKSPAGKFKGEGVNVSRSKIGIQRSAAFKGKAVNVSTEGTVSSTEIRSYTVQVIELATDNFNASKIIGKGVYGSVYQGSIEEMAVAIKVPSQNTQNTEETISVFNHEVEILSRVKHHNLITLLGVCHEKNILVYEFLNNGSLHDYLFKRGDRPPFFWRHRCYIAAEIGVVLNFLHLTKPYPLVHCDLKPDNILLDNNYKAKLADVGVARYITSPAPFMTELVGTHGYMDPEFIASRILCPKSDIFSLGIVILQLLTGQENAMGLVGRVKKAIKKNNLADLLDPSANWPLEVAISFAKLGLSCSESRAIDRPDLDDILARLGNLHD